MYGIGCWRYDPEAATKLLEKAGLEKRDDGWYFEDEPFSISMTYIADTEAQAGRGTTAAYDQLTKFGLNATIASESSATWSTNGSTGNYEIAGYWPTCSITADIYNQNSGWDNALILPLGEVGAGQGARWDNEEASELIRQLALTDPTSDEAIEIATEYIKVSTLDMPFIGFHSGVKFVPTNTTVWTNYPSADNPYNGPWWWWSCFKYIVQEIELAE